MGALDADTQGEIKRIWDQRRADRKSATKDADDRQAETLAAIKEVGDDVKRINGSLAKHETRITVMESREEDRKWSGGGGMVTPGRVVGTGAALGGSGLVYVAMEKMDAILDALSLLLGQ